jgi:hypothetical protein
VPVVLAMMMMMMMINTRSHAYVPVKVISKEYWSFLSFEAEDIRL